jgi:hypothetical protein
MSKSNRKQQYRPPELSRDHARPRTAPAPSDDALESHLTDLVSPATYALTSYYHRLGLRWRLLNLPVMVALVLTMIWRQVPSVSNLVQMISRQGLLWTMPMKVSQQAFSERLRTLPSELFKQVFHTLLPTLLDRASARTRPLSPIIAQSLSHFDHIWAVDATTLEALFRKVGLLRDVPEMVLGGKLLAVLDLPSKLPVHLWLEADPDVNEKSFLDRLKDVLGPRTLLLFDRGFYSFPLFDYLTDHQLTFVTRARSLAAFQVVQELSMSPQIHDRIISLGQYRSNPCRHPLRLVEVCFNGSWHRYLTNVLDPCVLSATDVADLYARRWQIEEAFLITKRLLGLSYLHTGAFNAIELQVWATWLLYAVLIDLSDAVAQELDLPLDRISIEMVFRGLYHFCTDQRPDQPTEPVAYLAAQPDLGIVKRRRKYREQPPLTDSSGA